MIDSTLCRNAKTMRFIFSVNREKTESSECRESIESISSNPIGPITQGLRQCMTPGQRDGYLLPHFFDADPFLRNPAALQPRGKRQAAFCVLVCHFTVSNAPQPHWYMLMLYQTLLWRGSGGGQTQVFTEHQVK